jgi:hypothetical protein
VAWKARHSWSIVAGGPLRQPTPVLGPRKGQLVLPVLVSAAIGVNAGGASAGRTTVAVGCKDGAFQEQVKERMDKPVFWPPISV